MINGTAKVAKVMPRARQQEHSAYATFAYALCSAYCSERLNMLCTVRMYCVRPDILASMQIGYHFTSLQRALLAIRSRWNAIYAWCAQSAAHCSTHVSPSLPWEGFSLQVVAYFNHADASAELCDDVRASRTRGCETRTVCCSSTWVSTQCLLLRSSGELRDS
jgi:hypothetical protein